MSLIKSDKKKISILSFYGFAKISNPNTFKAQILLYAKEKSVYGTIILSVEGVNGSISGKEENLYYIVNQIKKLTNIKETNTKVNYCYTKQPFCKMKVKVKQEVVGLKYSNLDIESLKGQYIETQDWDGFIQQPDVVTVDTRNNYEIKIGTFKGSINPDIKTFCQFPKWVANHLTLLRDKKIAMFCTGGIRCEKSTSFIKHIGIKNVFQLRGGIIQYLQDTKNRNGMWIGACFVFDNRGAISSNLSPLEGFWVKKGYTAKTMSESK